MVSSESESESVSVVVPRLRGDLLVVSDPGVRDCVVVVGLIVVGSVVVGLGVVGTATCHVGDGGTVITDELVALTTVLRSERSAGGWTLSL
ncbi:hypothetical protein, partial [Rhodococcoides fascians]|uniref:hypothetical protein n=1 Tax=Rhodococcoides fascians TaxID=1828 RepID=UPI00055AC8A8